MSTSIRPPSVIEIIRAREDFRQARLRKYFEWKRALQNAYDGQAYIEPAVDDGSAEAAALRVPSIVKRRGKSMSGGGAFSNMEEGGADLRAARNSVAQMVQRATVASKQAATTVDNAAAMASNDVLDNQALMNNPATASIVQQLMSTLQRIDTIASGAQLRDPNSRQAALVDIQDMAMGAQRLFTDANVTIPYTVARDAYSRVDTIINKLQSMEPPAPAQVLASLITVRSRLIPFTKGSPTVAPGAVQGSYASQLPPGASSSYNGAMGASPSGMAADAVRRGARPPGPPPPGSGGTFPPGGGPGPGGPGTFPPGGGPGSFPRGAYPPEGDTAPDGGPRATAGRFPRETVVGNTLVTIPEGMRIGQPSPPAAQTFAGDREQVARQRAAGTGSMRVDGPQQSGNLPATNDGRNVLNERQDAQGNVDTQQAGPDRTQSDLLGRAIDNSGGPTTRTPGTRPGQYAQQKNIYQPAAALSTVQRAVEDTGLAAARAQKGQQTVGPVTLAAAAADMGKDAKPAVVGPSAAESPARRTWAAAFDPARAATMRAAVAKLYRSPEYLKQLEDAKKAKDRLDSAPSIPKRVPSVPAAAAEPRPPPGPPPVNPDNVPIVNSLAERLFDVNTRVPTRIPGDTGKTAPARKKTSTQKELPRAASVMLSWKRMGRNDPRAARPDPPLPPTPQAPLQRRIEPEVVRAPIDERPRGADPQPHDAVDIEDTDAVSGTVGAAEVLRAAAKRRRGSVADLDAIKKRRIPEFEPVRPAPAQLAAASAAVEARRVAKERRAREAKQAQDEFASRFVAERQARDRMAAENVAMQAEDMAVRRMAATAAEVEARRQSEAAIADAARDSEARAKKSGARQMTEALQRVMDRFATRDARVRGLVERETAKRAKAAAAAREIAARAVREAEAAAARPDGIQRRGESGKKSGRDPEDDREQERERGRPGPSAAAVAPGFSANGADMMPKPNASDDRSAAAQRKKDDVMSFKEAMAFADETGADPLSKEHYTTFLKAMGKKKASEILKRQYLAEKDPDRRIRDGRSFLIRELNGFGSPEAMQQAPVEVHVSRNPRFKTVERALA